MERKSREKCKERRGLIFVSFFISSGKEGLSGNWTGLECKLQSGNEGISERRSNTLRGKERQKERKRNESTLSKQM